MTISPPNLNPALNLNLPVPGEAEIKIKIRIRTPKTPGTQDPIC